MQTQDFLHFCPTDGYFGDPMPIYHDGVYHVYYTKLYNDGRSMSWGHLSTRDFVHWHEHVDPFDALALRVRDLPLEHRRVPFNTGCIFVDRAGVFYAFFAGRDDQDRLCMMRARSADGEVFDTLGEVCFVRPEDASYGYRQDDTWRDPYVFFDQTAGVYRMVFCAKAVQKEHPDCFAGVIGQAVSNDLEHWTCLMPMHLRGVGTTMECPEIFAYQDRLVLLYYWHETRFRTANAIDGQWERGDVLSPDRFDFMAGRHMFDGKTHYLVGWLPRRACDCAERIWGGNMLFVRALCFKDGKTPQTRFVDALYRLFDKQNAEITPANAIFCGEGWTAAENRLCARAAVGGTMAMFAHLPDVCLMRMNVTMSDKNGVTSIFLGTHPAYSTQNESLDEGYVLMLDGAEQLIRLRRHYMWDQRNDIAVMPYRFCAGKTVQLEILRNRGIVEIGIDGVQTMVSRMLADASGGLALLVQDTDAVFEGLAVYEIGDDGEKA